MLLIHFRYPLLGLGLSVDFHQVGVALLYFSLAMSLISGLEYMRKFVRVLGDNARSS